MKIFRGIAQIITAFIHRTRHAAYKTQTQSQISTISNPDYELPGEKATDLGLGGAAHLDEEARPRADLDGEVGEPAQEEGRFTLLRKRGLVDAHVDAPREESLGFVVVG